jgi:hypothetical protein
MLVNDKGLIIPFGKGPSSHRRTQLDVYSRIRECRHIVRESKFWTFVLNILVPRVCLLGRKKLRGKYASR